jgi:hypothetical protein
MNSISEAMRDVAIPMMIKLKPGGRDAELTQRNKATKNTKDDAAIVPFVQPRYLQELLTD